MQALTLEALPEKVRLDREYGPAVYLLASPLLADKIPDAWVHLPHRFIDWEHLIPAARMWSSGEKMHVALAFNLWSGTSKYDWIDPQLHLNPWKWAATLADPSRLLEAIGLACGLAIPETSDVAELFAQ